MGRSGESGRGRALERALTPRRAEIYRATVPTRAGEARKVVVVVSRDATQTGLSTRSFVLCHDLLTIDPQMLDREPMGTLPLGKTLEVEDRLRYALDL